CTLEGIPPGKHLIQAVPARAWGEMIKKPEAFDFRLVTIEGKPDRTSLESFDPKAPLLILGMPDLRDDYFKGREADPLLFDFIVKNATLSENGIRVFYELKLLNTNRRVSDYLTNYPSTWHFNGL